jgi:DNA-binding CsgD family transcriptional regulator
VDQGISAPQLRSSDPGASIAAQISLLFAAIRELRAENATLLRNIRASLQELRVRQRLIRAEIHPEFPTGNRGLHAERRHTIQELYQMTAREAEVALLLADGCSNVTVARQLGISPHTARHHTQRVLGKLGVRSRALAGARLRHLLS